MNETKMFCLPEVMYAYRRLHNSKHF